MSEYKQCPNGLFYKGDSCPYCPTQLFPDECYQYGVCPPTDYIRSSEMTMVPSCRFCGRPLRKNVLSRVKGISSVHDSADGIVPWNYQWDGKCECCGHDYNFVMRLRTCSSFDNTSKETLVQVKTDKVMHHITGSVDENPGYTCLAGVEIRTGYGGVGGHLNHQQRVFLSANELKYLIEALKDSPIIKQFDYQIEGRF